MDLTNFKKYLQASSRLHTSRDRFARGVLQPAVRADLHFRAMRAPQRDPRRRQDAHRGEHDVRGPALRPDQPACAVEHVAGRATEHPLGGRSVLLQCGAPLFARSGTLTLTDRLRLPGRQPGRPGLQHERRPEPVVNGGQLERRHQRRRRDLRPDGNTQWRRHADAVFRLGAQALIAAGTPVTTTTVLWDSDDNHDAGGSPIVEVSPSFDGYDRKRQYTVTIRDVRGASFPGGPPS